MKTRFRTPVVRAAQHRDAFVGRLLPILGDTRLLLLPKATDTTTSTDESLNGRTITHGTSLVDRLSALGLGYAYSLSGTTQNATVPDADGLSFGDGSTDSAFTVLALANSTGASGTFISKYDVANTLREWVFFIDGNLKLGLYLFDESSDAEPKRISTPATTPSVWALYGATYSAATGGATAADDITLYSNGAVVASAATNSGSYTAMENTAEPVDIGAYGGGAAVRLAGNLAMVALCQKALSASEHWAVKKLVNGYFKLAL